MTSQDDSVPISERVRFWEEQDRINQELIPRVIRQHELLTEHIGEHENLPAVVAGAVQQASADAREEQRQIYEAALESAKAGFDNRAAEQRQQYETALESAQSEFNKQLSETLQQQSNSMRALFIRVAAVSGLIIVVLSALTAVIVG